MRKLIAVWLFGGLVGSAQAQVGQVSQVFDLNTYTLSLPSVLVGTSTYAVGLHYDADGRLSIQSLQSAVPSIVGSWYPDTSRNALPAGLAMVFTFLPDGTYVLADNGNTTAADPSGQPGIEVGTYTYNPSTGAFSTACPSINTDGQWGLSHNRQGGATGCTGTGGTVTIQGNSLTLTITSPGTSPSYIYLTR